MQKDNFLTEAHKSMTSEQRQEIAEILTDNIIKEAFSLSNWKSEQEEKRYFELLNAMNQTQRKQLIKLITGIIE